ncbi:MAG: nucleoid-associated protein [Firmicutes bacterium]|nr:nucleoid-associated protein [Bacillota bacterium]
MAITIDNAILHILDNTSDEPLISSEELDIESEICEVFITKHLKRLMTAPNAKDAVFAGDSPALPVVKQYINGEIFFKAASAALCRQLFGIMRANAEIPPGDVLVVHFKNRGERFLAILKLNYKPCYVHRTDSRDGVSDNQILMAASLPFGGGKVEEACLIPFEPMVLRVIEKAYPVDGEETYYFSKLFLKCQPELSQAEAAGIIADVTEQIAGKYLAAEPKKAALLKNILIEQAEEDDSVNLSAAAAEVFGPNSEIRAEYAGLAEEAGLKPDVCVPARMVKAKLGFQRIKSANGVEVRMPVEFSQESDAVEYISNEDGTTSIVIKNLPGIEIY